MKERDKQTADRDRERKAKWWMLCVGVEIGGGGTIKEEKEGRTKMKQMKKKLREIGTETCV